jgi:hypothetical protein
VGILAGTLKSIRCDKPGKGIQRLKSLVSLHPTTVTAFRTPFKHFPFAPPANHPLKSSLSLILLDNSWGSLPGGGQNENLERGRQSFIMARKRDLQNRSTTKPPTSRPAA